MDEIREDDKKNQEEIKKINSKTKTYQSVNLLK